MKRTKKNIPLVKTFDICLHPNSHNVFDTTKGWPTSDEDDPAMQINFIPDGHHNGNPVAICLSFGKRPVLTLYGLQENGDLGDELFCKEL